MNKIVKTANIALLLAASAVATKARLTINHG